MYPAEEDQGYVPPEDDVDVGGAGYDFQNEQEVQASRKYPANLKFTFNVSGTGEKAIFRMTIDSEIG